MGFSREKLFGSGKKVGLFFNLLLIGYVILGKLFLFIFYREFLER